MANKLDELVKSQKAPVIVIPVKTGIQENQSRGGSDGLGDFFTKPSNLTIKKGWPQFGSVSLSDHTAQNALCHTKEKIWG